MQEIKLDISHSRNKRIFDCLHPYDLEVVRFLVARGAVLTGSAAVQQYSRKLGVKERIKRDSWLTFIVSVEDRSTIVFIEQSLKDYGYSLYPGFNVILKIFTYPGRSSINILLDCTYETFKNSDKVRGVRVLDSVELFFYYLNKYLTGDDYKDTLYNVYDIVAAQDRVSELQKELNGMCLSDEDIDKIDKLLDGYTEA